MPAVLRSPADVTRWTRSVREVFVRHLTRAMVETLREVIALARRTSAFRNRTGNTRASIGANVEPLIPAAATRLVGQFRADPRQLVAVFRNEIVGVFQGGAMEYDPALLARTDYLDEALAAAPEILRRNLEAAHAAAHAEIAGLAA